MFCFGTFMTRKTNVQFGDFQWQFWVGKNEQLAGSALESLEGIFTDFSSSSRFILGLQGHRIQSC